ncbi:hypothetical protein FQN54_005319 [Arachnomyces sp. PD_36]|nr:hypothetical protein FQN54_005319 [Arachnomyces sp. PD_36]
MADYRLPPHQVPRRKPLPGGNSGLQFHSAPHHSPQPPPQQAPPNPPMPPVSHHQYQPHPPPAQYMNQQPQRLGVAPQHAALSAGDPGPARRLSSATASSISNGGNAQPSRHPSNSSGDIHRSVSSRSGGPALSYVAMMRKQKATVWSDRAQPEDPRLVAQKKAARKRANMEIHGNPARTPAPASGSMVGKIRHHGVPKAPGYSAATFVGAGVPLRLSANEVGHAEEDIDKPEPKPIHKRTGSGRSSVGSNRFPSGYQRPQQGRFSSSSTPPNAEPGDIRNPEIPEVAEDTPKENETPSTTTNTGAAPSINASSDSGTRNPAASTHSFSDREDSFGAVTEMAAPSGAVAAAQKAKTAEDLKRRGSVDDRSMTMSGVRLYIANPDLSD